MPVEWQTGVPVPIVKGGTGGCAPIIEVYPTQPPLESLHQSARGKGPIDCQTLGSGEAMLDKLFSPGGAATKVMRVRPANPHVL